MTIAITAILGLAFLLWVAATVLVLRQGQASRVLMWRTIAAMVGLATVQCAFLLGCALAGDLGGGLSLAAAALTLLAASSVLAGFLHLAPQIADIRQTTSILAQRSEQIEALRHVGLEIVSELDVDALLHSIVQRAMELLGGNAGGFYLYRPERDVLEWSVAVGADLAPLGSVLRRGEGLSGKVWETGEPIIVDDYSRWPGQAEAYRGRPWKAVIGVPVYWGEQFLGVLDVLAAPLRTFTQADATLLSQFANQAAIAIRNAQLVASLRESEERYRQLAENVQDAIWLGTPDGGEWGRVLYVNPAFEKIFGLKAEEALASDRVWLDLVHEEDRARVLEALGRFLRGEGEYDIEYRIVRRDGELRWIWMRGFVIADAQGKLRHIAGVAQDITARKEEAELQQRVAQHQQMAAIGQLAAGIAHDFNNLLTSVIGYAELLREDLNLPSQAKEDLAAIVREGKRGALLVRQILDFSRRSLRIVRLEDLRNLVEGVLGFWQRTFPESIKLSLECMPGDYIVQADASQLRQALTNLALNARDAMPDGGKLHIQMSQLEVALGHSGPMAGMWPGKWVRLALSDTGAGMSPEVLQHLFKPFFTTKLPDKGTGLGLAQVYGIIRQHDGQIAVESEPGRGTTFTMYLPLVAEAAEESLSEESDIPHGQGEWVLLVEDDRHVAEMGRALLTSLDYIALMARDGQGALRIYERERDQIALVLADWVLPDMDGAELYRRLKWISPTLKMIATSGYPLQEEAEALLAEGAVGWIKKPFSRGELARVLHGMLAEEKSIGRWQR